MRRAANKDGNQTEIVSKLRKCGVSVQILSETGVPDILWGFRGVTGLLELKDSAKPPSAQKLTKDQERWHAKWAGQKAVVNSFKDAMDVILAHVDCFRPSIAPPKFVISSDKKSA